MKFLRSLPESIRTDSPGWTADDLFYVFSPLHPGIQKYEDHNDLNTLFHRKIHRIPNPAFKHRFSQEPCGASEFLYDQADALFYAARRWGGYECRFQAKTAHDELGWLRDVRYVFPALRDKDMRIRLTGVACLAFLWSTEGNDYLRQIVSEDPEPGVRQSALWAYGFAGGIDAQELLRERSENDADNYARAFAKQALQLGERGWWGF
jgi:hypothetical protein